MKSEELRKLISEEIKKIISEDDLSGFRGNTRSYDDYATNKSYYLTQSLQEILLKINRLEVIESKNGGRKYVNNNVKDIKGYLQDGNKTLKLFIE